ncbi:MAG: hypothetical protein AB7H88_03330 [Vicinamibacterales bacterium]
MSFDPAFLLVSLAASGVGFVLFSYGRKQARLPQVVGGVALMVYPYFVSTVPGLLLAGAVIGAAVWAALRQGW